MVVVMVMMMSNSDTAKWWHREPEAMWFLFRI